MPKVTNPPSASPARLVGDFFGLLYEVSMTIIFVLLISFLPVCLIFIGLDLAYEVFFNAEPSGFLLVLGGVLSLSIGIGWTLNELKHG